MNGRGLKRQTDCMHIVASIRQTAAEDIAQRDASARELESKCWRAGRLWIPAHGFQLSLEAQALSLSTSLGASHGTGTRLRGYAFLALVSSCAQDCIMLQFASPMQIAAAFAFHRVMAALPGGWEGSGCSKPKSI